jgi:acyl-CoA synthetase (AMP-forming)/AMP-acid ligase II
MTITAAAEPTTSMRTTPFSGRWVTRGPGGCRASTLKDGWLHTEVVVAFVVGSVAAELDAHLLERIARFKRPKRYEFIDDLPKNSYGKVLIRELRNKLV